MAYRPANVVLFLAEHRNLVGDRTPHMIATAYREARRCGMYPMFPAACTETIFSGNVNLQRAFAGAVEADMRHIMLGLGQQPLDIITLFTALFDDLPEELKHFFEGKQEGDEIDITALLKEMGELLRSRGVEWEDRWFVSDPTPEEPAPADNPQ